MQIIIDDLSSPAVHDLLREHLDDMAAQSPPESTHALDLTELRKPNIDFWTVWEAHSLMGCGAMKELNPDHGEIKSMRTAKQHLRKGVAAAVLKHIVSVARERNYQQISLETGSMDAFKPAHNLYRKFGFVECDPFADYQPDPNSIFMTLHL